MLKDRIKRLIGRTVDRDLFERLTEYVIAASEPSVSLAGAETVPSPDDWQQSRTTARQYLWNRLIERLPSSDVLFLEFGVWRGESLCFFAEALSSPQSRFFGFDSFEGLPEEWRGNPTGLFDESGRMPKIDDARVELVKGWFNATLPGKLAELEELGRTRTLLVHFDADLYSSTLYVLFMLASRFKYFYFVFDEFTGHETRALFNFIQGTGAKATYFDRLDWERQPLVVSGELRIP